MIFYLHFVFRLTSAQPFSAPGSNGDIKLIIEFKDSIQLGSVSLVSPNNIEEFGVKYKSPGEHFGSEEVFIQDMALEKAKKLYDSQGLFLT